MVIGAGPCGLLAALVLAQMGLRPIIVERGKAVRERTKDTWGAVAAFGAGPGKQRPVRRRRCRHVLGRQALQPHQGSAPSRPQGADRVRQGRCARRHPDRSAPAYRHIPPCHHGDEHARSDREAGRRIPLRHPRR
ncbi:FAD-dependent monooxygenase [Novosphingobium colocasiae]